MVDPPSSPGITLHETTELEDWLRRKGVPKKKIDVLIMSSGCTDTTSLALYLRLQLPPLELANPGCIKEDMQALFGVSFGTARSMLKELDVQSAMQLLGGLPGCPFVASGRAAPVGHA